MQTDAERKAIAHRNRNNLELLVGTVFIAVAMTAAFNTIQPLDTEQQSITWEIRR